MKTIQQLENYNLVETSPIKLLRESNDNIVLVIGRKDKKILRISKRLPVADIKFEYEAVNHLAEGGIPVPKWLKTKTGNFYTLIDGQVSVLFDFLEGHHIELDQDHPPTLTQAYNAGKGLGRISRTASGFVSTSPRTRNVFSELERAIALSAVFAKQFEGGKAFIEQVKEAISFAQGHHEIKGFIHNDYRSSNVFFDTNDEFIGIIDFDWSCIGPIIKDLALAIVEWSFPDGASNPNPQVFDSFLAGYNSAASYQWRKNQQLYSWIRFATLSDASTYFCDLADDPNSTKRIIKSYMYRKYLFFSKI